MKTKEEIIYKKLKLKLCWYRSARRYVRTKNIVDLSLMISFKNRIELLNWILNENN